MIILFYLMGAVLSYLIINSLVVNTWNKNSYYNISNILIYVSIISYTIGSWMSIILFGIILGFDYHYRRYLFPIHYKLFRKQ